ncbi:MAG: FKBP-type peptidyl-prolyl cis-trans isomerase [Treponema sp.]|jgi:FKBP-type peptidyl-prolyl cis-trans isomerase FkpA|nr:FKBP-type peptidyl-prolyl cis-trans isomerase [Treponema sp.]
MIKKSVIIMCLGIGMICACENAKSSALAGSGGTGIDKDTSYAFGMVISEPFKDMNMEFDYDALMLGFREYIENKKTKFTIEEAIGKANTVYGQAREVRSEVFKEEQTVFLTENKKKTEVQSTASGLQYEVITEGTGKKPLLTDTVQVHYEGALTNGTVFDSSYDRGEPIEFPLQGVIAGWTEGLQLMPVGSTYRLFIPSDLGYGSQGAGGGVIPPHATLIFKVELLSIVNSDDAGLETE